MTLSITRALLGLGQSGNTIFFLPPSLFFGAGAGVKRGQLNTVRVRKQGNERVLRVP